MSNYPLAATSVTSSIGTARAIFKMAHGHDLTRAACGCALQQAEHAKLN